ncbi:hypothetical protein BVE79_23815 [Salmonella enterica]|nr:hypothetical protein LFZ36_09610 [Salmonella enterica subsp. enterica serovar Ouakam str. SA20034636]EAM8688748.1 hypothetical protein [Salmonella enterica]EBW8616879.1 hypothetical protein [Salmonella enterica subsp. enterica serovar Enteritidis]ECH9692241.1 hypothetical protein [Salmonella enterica subsp. enterica]ECS6964718.1 hypothetical protein [Salmonella enterica subsp. enterica serovar Ouakam]
MGYDDAGRALWLENEKGERYAFEHDELHRLISQTDIGGVRHHWRYTSTGLMEEHRVEGVPVQPGGRPQSLIYRYGHDASGRLLHRDNGETQLRYEYGRNAVTIKRFRQDELLRATEESREAEPLDKIKLKYDGRGLLITEENRAGKHEHEYDPLGNLLKTRLPDGRSLENLYYGSGHLLETQLRDGEHTFQLVEYERDNLHREVHRRQGNLWRQTEYDVSGRISHRRTARERNSIQGITAESWYSWDNGDRLVMERQGWPKEPVPQVRVYKWDSADRIISVVQNDNFGEREEELRYDACGNLFDRKPSTANQLDEYRGIQYRYDAFGRLSRKWNASQDQRFEYDADSQLVRVESVRGTLYTQVEMEYDLLGRRTVKRAYHRWTNAVEETQFGWAGLRLYSEKRSDCPEVLFSYEESSYAPLARVVGRGDAARVQWFRNGLNGNPEALTDADGAVKWRQHWPSLWGRSGNEALTDGQGVMQNLRFQGQYLDRETGLHYNLFRYYDPDCGRFTQPDPANLNGGVNLYQYAPNPLSWIDPLGLVKAPDSLPDTPGVYTVYDDNDVYVGSAGGGEGGMNTRVSTTGHKSVQDILEKEGVIVEHQEVDLGTATDRADREGILRHYEQQEIDRQQQSGRTVKNKRRAESTRRKKVQSNKDLITKHGASIKPRKICRGKVG